MNNKLDGIEIVDISALKQDELNANLGTDRGRTALGESIERYGVGRGVLVDKDNRLIGGNKTTEAAILAGVKRVVLVESNGDVLVVTKRTDLDLDKDEEARMLAHADNRVQALDYNPVVEQVLADAEKMDMEWLWAEQELTALRQSEQEESVVRDTFPLDEMDVPDPLDFSDDEDDESPAPEQDEKPEDGMPDGDYEMQVFTVFTLKMPLDDGDLFEGRLTEMLRGFTNTSLKKQIKQEAVHLSVAAAQGFLEQGQIAIPAAEAVLAAPDDVVELLQERFPDAQFVLNAEIEGLKFDVLSKDAHIGVVFGKRKDARKLAGCMKRHEYRYVRLPEGVLVTELRGFFDENR